MANDTPVTIEIPFGHKPEQQLLLRVHSPRSVQDGTDRRTILLVGGYSMHDASYGALVKFLTDKGFRVVVVDMFATGSGVQPSWSVERQIASLQDLALVETVKRFGSVEVVSHSFGARHILALAAQGHRRILRHVTITPALFLNPLLRAFAPLTPVAALGMMLLPAPLAQWMVTKVFTFLLGPGTAHVAALIARDLWGTRRDQWRMALIGGLLLLLGHRMAFPGPQVPTRCIRATQDVLALDVPVPLDVDLVTVPGGHDPVGNATADAVLGFLQ